MNRGLLGCTVVHIDGWMVVVNAVNVLKLWISLCTTHDHALIIPDIVFVDDLVPEAVKANGTNLSNVAKKIKFFLCSGIVRILIHKNLPYFLLFSRFLYHTLQVLSQWGSRVLRVASLLGAKGNFTLRIRNVQVVSFRNTLFGAMNDLRERKLVTLISHYLANVDLSLKWILWQLLRRLLNMMILHWSILWCR